MELRGLSLMTIKICSSFSRLMKLPNQDFLASLKGRKLSDYSSSSDKQHCTILGFKINEYCSLSYFIIPLLLLLSNVFHISRNCTLCHFPPCQLLSTELRRSLADMKVICGHLVCVDLSTIPTCSIPQAFFSN